jgi:hypothetical protein
MPTTVRLKALLQERHWQKHATFCREYDRAAEAIDPDLKGTYPGRAQLHRWLSGELKGLPYPDHCRILERMFPGWTAAQLMEPYSEDEPLDAPGSANDRLFAAVAAGLSEPDAGRPDWGEAAPMHGTLATVLPRSLSEQAASGGDEASRGIGRTLIEFAALARMDVDQTYQLARLAGNVVELSQRVDIAIDRDGWGSITYRHELFNMTARALTRLSRELWFEHVQGHLTIEALDEPGRRVSVQRQHDTGTLAKFACKIAPAVRPGETAVIGYTCNGGRFLSDHYWRQGVSRYTRHLTINLTHRGAGRLLDCAVTEEHPDGSENSAAESLLWDDVGGDLTITLTRDYLRPGQAVTLRWKASGAVT